jgi:hypothetical protein
MKVLAASLLVVIIAACSPGVHSNPVADGPVADAPPGDGADGAPPGDGADAPPADAPLETRKLGMNDVSMVLSTLQAGAFGRMDGIDGARDLVPRDLYHRVATSHRDIAFNFSDFILFAIRFDLCDRAATGPCPEGVDGSLRLVFQPLVPIAAAADAGLHAFYTIPAAELGFVVNELRAIARLSSPSPLGPLRGIGIGMVGELRQRLLGLVDRYARTDRLIRLSVMGQDVRSAEPRVVFRGVELRNGEMVDMTVGTLEATQQEAALTGSDSTYDVAPLADQPAGLALALQASAFDAATPAEQRTALDALVATENPTLHTAATAQCVTCHTSTHLVARRALSAGIDISSLPSFFTTTRDTRILNGISAGSARSLHAFGWLGNSITISQRVANETAIVLDEIEQRFPVPGP